MFTQLLRAIELEILYTQHSYLSRRAFALAASGLFSATFDENCECDRESERYYAMRRFN
jgi:hypothetical protein